MSDTQLMPTIIQSPEDNREFKLIKLKNDLICLVISDPEIDKSSAALCVNCGQLEDPEDRQGIAHFLEHMLFLGTEKYPQAGEFDEFLGKNSGYSNAYTSMSVTNYYFESSNDALEDAIDRFAQFFISPLFTEELSNREMNAVNSEHEKNIMQDQWREWHLFRKTSKPNSCFNQFGTGNLETLQHPTIRDDLIKFYKRYYSANLMRCVIYGAQDIPTLTKMAEKFQDVPNQKLGKNVYTDHPFPKDHMKVFMKVEPVSDKDTLNFIWIIDNMQPHYRSDPANYFSYLFGHEGKNSLLSLLIEQGLAEGLSAGKENLMDLFTTFEVEIELTKKGLEQYEKVVEYVFKYLQVLKKQGTQQWLFEEIKNEKQTAMNTSYALAAKMQTYDLQDILRVNEMMETFNPELFQKTIDSFTIDNLRLTLISKSMKDKVNQTEKFYQIKYAVEPLPESIIKLYNPSTTEVQESKLILALPQQNKFVPKSLKIVQNDYPQLLVKNEWIDGFFLGTNKFKSPKAALNVKLSTNDNDVTLNPLSNLYAKLWLNLFEIEVKELAYEAEMAQLRSDITFSNEEFYEITIFGFNDSLYNYTDEYFKLLKSFDPSKNPEQFKVQYDLLKKTYDNFYKKQPYQQADSYYKSMMSTGHFDNSKFQQEIKNVTFELFCQFSKTWLKNIHIQLLLNGNFMINEAQNLINNIQSILAQNSSPLQQDKTPLKRVIDLPSSEVPTVFSQVLDSEQTNSLVILTFQQDKFDLENDAKLRFIRDYFDSSFYITEQQLGYLVWSFHENLRGVGSFKFEVQSDVKSCEYVSARIWEFLEQQKEKMKNLKEEEFQKIRKSAYDSAAEKDVNLKQQQNRFWKEVANNQRIFDKQEQIKTLIQGLTLEVVQNFFETVFFKNRKVYEMHLTTENFKEDNEKLKAERIQKQSEIKYIDNAEEFKKKQTLYPDFFMRNN